MSLLKYNYQKGYLYSFGYFTEIIWNSKNVFLLSPIEQQKLAKKKDFGLLFLCVALRLNGREAEKKGLFLFDTMESLFHMICCLVTHVLCLCAKKVAHLALSGLVASHHRSLPFICIYRNVYHEQQLLSKTTRKFVDSQGTLFVLFFNRFQCLFLKAHVCKTTRHILFYLFFLFTSYRASSASW